MPLVCGIDPGTSNLGLAFIDPETETAVMIVVDIHVWGEYTYVMKGQYTMSQRVIDLVTSEPLAPLLQQTIALGCERMDHPASNMEVRFLAAIFEQTIRCIYPQLEYYLVRAQDVRAFWQTGGGGSYIERKKKSLGTSILSRYDHARYDTVFRKSIVQKDAIEAAQIATFIYYYLSTTTRSDVKPVMQPGAKDKLKIKGPAPPDKGFRHMTVKVDFRRAIERARVRDEQKAQRKVKRAGSKKVPVRARTGELPKKTKRLKRSARTEVIEVESSSVSS